MNKTDYWDSLYLNSPWGKNICIGRYASLPAAAHKEMYSLALSIVSDNGFESIINKSKISNHFEEAIRCSNEYTSQLVLKSSSIIRHIEKEGIKVLDLCCGSGSFLELLSSRFQNGSFFGFDFSDEAIKLAKNRKLDEEKVKFEKILDFSTLETKKWCPRKLDGIVLRDSYYLLNDNERDSLFKFASKNLIPGGFILIQDFVAMETSNPYGNDVLDERIIKRQCANKIVGVKMPEMKISEGEEFRIGNEFYVDRVEVDFDSVPFSYSAAYANGFLSDSDRNLLNAYKDIISISLEKKKKWNHWFGKSSVEMPLLAHGSFLLKLKQAPGSKSIKNFARIVIKNGFSYSALNKGLTKRENILETGEINIPLIEESTSKKLWILVVGSSGSGKSTLMKILGGQLTHSEVMVEFNPVNLTKFFLPQDSLLVDELNAIENVEIFSEEFDTVEKWLTYVGLWSRKERLKKVKYLSGGQRQRVGFCQAVMSKANLLILDEPFSGVDPVRKRLLFQFLKEASPDSSVIIVDHNFQGYADKFDFIYEMIDGRLYLVKK